MKLIFNPLYDSKVFVKVQGCMIGKKVVGPQGLLDELELRAGLTGRRMDSFQRVVVYARAMKKAVENHADLFFAKSFEKDKLGTAAIVLGWRDALVKLGWSKEIADSCRLRDLALVEACFEEKGGADRWRTLLAQAKTMPLIAQEDMLEVTCQKQHLEPLYAQLFEAMEAQGCVVNYVSPADGQVSEKAEVLSFKNDLEMAEWLAQQSFDNEDVVAGNDTSIFNINLAVEGKPQVGSESNAIGAIMQVFTLGLSLFNKPLNVNTLLAYLQLPKTPLNALCLKRKADDGSEYTLSLRRALFEQLLNDNGIGESWNALIEEAVCDTDGNSKKRNEALLFVNQWERARGEGDACMVAKEEVKKYLEAMKKWAKSNLYDEDMAMQFNAVAVNCETMLMILEDEPADIKTHDLMLWAAQVSRPVELASLSARKGSANVVPAVTDIYSSPQSLYWICSTPEYNFQYEYDFLSPAEVAALKQHGVAVPERETLLKARREMMLRVLSNVRCRIVLLECEIMGGLTPVEDPVATELRHTGKLVSQPMSPDRHDWEQRPVESASTKQGEYQVNDEIFSQIDVEKGNGGMKRDSESYSSLDELIQRPFDYVMDYILHLCEYGKAAMADIDTVKGNVAHAYMETLTKQGQCNVKAMRQIHRCQCDVLVGRLAETTGAILLLEENDLEFKRFKSLLRKSVDVLLDIIEQNGLSIVGAEMKLEAVIPVIGKMNARIDYLLTDKDGNYVIFDFKWNEGQTYKKRLVQNDALQLAVYRAIVEQWQAAEGGDRKVSFMGYFVLPLHTLFTVYNTMNWSGNIEVVTPENSADLMRWATNSFTYRMNQLKVGLIEEGEGLLLADLQYEKDTASRQLYPLRREYNSENAKAASYGNKNIVLKGGLE